MVEFKFAEEPFLHVHAFLALQALALEVLALEVFALEVLAVVVKKRMREIPLPRQTVRRRGSNFSQNGLLSLALLVSFYQAKAHASDNCSCRI